MSRRITDLVTAMVLGLLALIVFRSAQAIPPSLLDTRFGAGLLPSVLAIVLALLAIILTIGAFTKKVRVDVEPSSPSFQSSLATSSRGVLVAILLAAYIAVLDAGVATFLLASTVFVFLSTLCMVRITMRSTLLAGANALVISAAIQFLFTKVFSVFLP